MIIGRLIDCRNWTCLLRSNRYRFFHRSHAIESESKLCERAVEVKDRDKFRNIGIVAHINAGKTTTTERILYHAGYTDSVGDVDKGNTVTDYLVQERDRGITITSAAVSYNWKKHRVNLIDTPGHVDFTIEVERSLSVLDGAVTILDASAGVEAQTITVWNQATKYQLPNVIFLNKLDKPQADHTMCMNDLKNSLGINASLIQLPIKSKDHGFSSIVDIVRRQCITWLNPDKDYGSKFSLRRLDEANLDKSYSEKVEEEREKLINLLSDLDDELANHVIQCDKIGDLADDIIIQAIRRATISCQLCPVLLGSSFKFIGVQQLMDSILTYLPSPVDREKQIKNLLGMNIEESKANCAFIFKIMHDKRLGPLTYMKICQGSLKKLQYVQNLQNQKIEQIKKIYRVHADELKEIEGSVYKDDIVVVTGMSESRTSDIIVDRNFELKPEGGAPLEFSQARNGDPLAPIANMPFTLLNEEILVPQITRMEPVYFCSIEAMSLSQQNKLESALACLSREDPSFTFDIDRMGVITIRGMGKLHLDIARDRIKSEFGIDSMLGPLQISYRETIEGSATEEFSVDKLVNGVKSSLTIKLSIKAKPGAGAWSGKMLRLDTKGENSLGKLRFDHRKAIESGLLSALGNGPTLGYPMIDCDILLLDFIANRRCGLPIISSAASQCLMNAVRQCSPALMEPIMLLEVVVPSEHNGLILGDISARRGVVLSTSARQNGAIVVKSRTPLATLADYSEFLRIKTSGRASFSMELFNYSAMSEADKQNVVRL